MDKFLLSAADICRIIKQCDASGVQVFELQGLKLSFYPRRNEDSGLLSQAPVLYEDALPETNKSTAPQRTLMDIMDEEALMEAEQAQLLIDDPLSFEKMQISNHIERSRMLNEKT